MLSGDDVVGPGFEDQKFFTRHKTVHNLIAKQLQAVCILPVRVRVVSKRNLRPPKAIGPLKFIGALDLCAAFLVNQPHPRAWCGLQCVPVLSHTNGNLAPGVGTCVLG